MKEKFVKAIEDETVEILITKVTDKDSVVFDHDYCLEFTELQQDPDGGIPTAINEGTALVWSGAALIFAGTASCDMSNAAEIMASAKFSAATIDKVIEVIKKLQKGDENI